MEQTAADQAMNQSLDACRPVDTFVRRHVGPTESQVREMLEFVGFDSLDSLVRETIPADIFHEGSLALCDPAAGSDQPDRGESEVLARLRNIAELNTIKRSWIGLGYSNCITPEVIKRNILENPCWYTQYTPYQAEIAQGRLEALLNFQTMITDLAGMEIAGASLLDEPTAAAEAMAMCISIARGKKRRFHVDQTCHPQTVAVLETRAEPLGIDLVIGPVDDIDTSDPELAGVLVQYPDTSGEVRDHEQLAARLHESDSLLVVAADLLSLVMLRSPGDFGADIVVGNSQRFGVPMGLGGPHAAFMATREKFVRKMPGRLIGVSRDSNGEPALRMAIQTREQHIKRDRATSNICTAQVLLAIMSGFYAVYHGPEGLRKIARRTHERTCMLADGLRRLGHEVGSSIFFDTIRVNLADTMDHETVHQRALDAGMNLRRYADGSVGISLDETTDSEDLATLLSCFSADGQCPELKDLQQSTSIPESMRRTGDILGQEVFNSYHSETELLRYITRLQSRDLSLAHSMIPLGSCTMKLNATVEMVPVTWPEFGSLHPFAPSDQWNGYKAMFEQLEQWLCEITGFAACSLQPNAGSQGEYAGLMTIRACLKARGQGERNACLIPVSAHGTNPASAIVAGMTVVPVGCDKHGNIDIEDLRKKAGEHADDLAALMITYPSTHGVFETSVREVCSIIHEHGGLVYMDGANMNAQVGLARPGDIGADVCHLNLHKTFCIPHGGGGPGMGPIAVSEELANFLPSHPIHRPDSAGPNAIGPISAAPYGSASILPISWMYIALMGSRGLRHASQVAILNANYMAERLKDHYDILYKSKQGRVAHEFIIDCRPFESTADIRIDDIAKRLMDFGFHAPTMAWPVAGTLMIEPTESESRDELDRYCDALIRIRQEIGRIEDGTADREDNTLRNAPHTIRMIGSDDWTHPYSRESAAWPLPWLRDRKFWPPVGRVDNPHGDRNLVCTCIDVASAAGE